jgi:cytoskeletal protein CcmA (bactofilin family)
MWTKDAQSEVPGTSPAGTSPSKDSRIPAAPVSAPGTPGINRPAAPVARTLACLGSTITIKGQITGDEDLQIEGKVEGPISLNGHRLTVGRTAQLNSEMTAREIIVYGNASGNLYARDRVEIKKDGQVIGDIVTARISIEDGAYFKGSIEIERGQTSGKESKETEEIPVGAA